MFTPTCSSVLRALTLVALAIGGFYQTASADVIVSQWNFNGLADATAPTPNLGTGTASLLGTTGSFASQTGSTDPNAGSGWGVTGFPAQGTDSRIEGVRFNVPTTGFDNIRVSWDHRLSNTSSRWYQFRYTTDGTNFLELATPVRLGALDNAGDTWHNNNIADLSSIPGVNNNPNFGFQVLSSFSPVAFTEVQTSTNFLADAAYEVARNNGSSTYAGTGTWRFDMVTVTSVPEPTSLSLLTIGAVGLMRRRRNRV
jgi:hypothetical protein